MATIQEIREGLAVNLRTIGELQVDAYNLSNPTPPTATVLPSLIIYDQAMQRGDDELSFVVQVVVGLATDRAAQMKLDTYMESTGVTSIKTALETDTTLGGSVDDLHVSECSGYKQFAVEGRAVLLGCEWTVKVVASN